MARKPERGGGAIPDAHLWRAVADSTRPLKRRSRAAATSPGAWSAPAAPGKQAAAPPKAEVARRPPAARPRPPAPALKPGPGALPGVDRNTAQRFRRGDMAIEATLDLHGMTQPAAHAALIAFIARARAAGLRCLLIVTGKGGRTGAGGETTGVLRANAPRWLNEPGLRAGILAVAHARPRHGGEGALYVLLKRACESGPR